MNGEKISKEISVILNLPSSEENVKALNALLCELFESIKIIALRYEEKQSKQDKSERQEKQNLRKSRDKENKQDKDNKQEKDKQENDDRQDKDNKQDKDNPGTTRSGDSGKAPQTRIEVDEKTNKQ